MRPQLTKNVNHKENAMCISVYKFDHAVSLAAVRHELAKLGAFNLVAAGELFDLAHLAEAGLPGEFKCVTVTIPLNSVAAIRLDGEFYRICYRKFNCRMSVERTRGPDATAAKSVKVTLGLNDEPVDRDLESLAKSLKGDIDEFHKKLEHNLLEMKCLAERAVASERNVEQGTGEREAAQNKFQIEFNDGLLSVIEAGCKMVEKFVVYDDDKHVDADALRIALELVEVWERRYGVGAADHFDKNSGMPACVPNQKENER